MLLAILAALHTYIIPIYGRNFGGSTAAWNSTILASNATDQTAVLAVDQVLPLLEGPCPTVPCGQQSYPIAPKSTRSIDFIEDVNAGLTAGAVVLSSDQPLTIETFLISRPLNSSGPSAYQTVPVISDWIPAGVETWIPRAMNGFADESINFFAVNPNDDPLVIEFTRTVGQAWADPLIVAPRSTAMRRLDVVIDQPGATAAGLPLYFRCSDRCMVSTSNGSLTRVPIMPGSTSVSVTPRRRVADPVIEIDPSCDSPAVFTRSTDPGPGYLFVYRDGIDVQSTTAQLAAKYGFAVRAVFVGPPYNAFWAIVDGKTLAELRCEPSISSVNQNSAGSPAATHS